MRAIFASIQLNVLPSDEVSFSSGSVIVSTRLRIPGALTPEEVKRLVLRAAENSPEVRALMARLRAIAVRIAGEMLEEAFRKTYRMLVGVKS